MKNHVVRFGGLVPSYVVRFSAPTEKDCDSLVLSPQIQEAKKYTKEEAEYIALELGAKQTCGVSARQIQ